MKKGIHPALRTMRIVLRNGASIDVSTVLNRFTPYVLQTDLTVHPAWTGQKSGLSVEDERISRILKRFDGFVKTGEEEKIAE